MKRSFVVGLLALVVASGVACDEPAHTPAPAPELAVTSTATRTANPTPTQAPPSPSTPTPTAARTVNPTPTQTPTSPSTPTPTAAPTPSATESAAALAPDCGPRPATARTVEAVPPEVASSALWPLPNHDYASTRATFDSKITTATVDGLEVAWMFVFPETTRWGAAASNPLVLDGVVYMQDLPSNIYAFDLVSGDLLWKRDGEGPSLAPNGLAVGWGRVFAASSRWTARRGSWSGGPR